MIVEQIISPEKSITKEQESVKTDELIDLVNERKNIAKSKTWCGRLIYPHWTLIIPDSSFLASASCAAYQYTQKQDVIGGILSAVALGCLVTRFVMAYFIPRKSLEGQVDLMEKNVRLFKDGENDLTNEQKLQIVEVDKISTINNNLGKNIYDVEVLNKKLSGEIKEIYKEKDEEKKQEEIKISNIEKITNNLMIVAKEENDVNKNNIKQMISNESKIEKEISELKQQINLLSKQVKILEQENNKFKLVDENLDKNIQKLQEEDSKIEELTKNFKESTETNQQLQLKLQKAEKERNQFEQKINEQEKHLEEHAAKLEETANKLYTEVNKKKKELDEKEKELESMKNNLEKRENEIKKKEKK